MKAKHESRNDSSDKTKQSDSARDQAYFSAANFNCKDFSPDKQSRIASTTPIVCAIVLYEIHQIRNKPLDTSPNYTILYSPSPPMI